MYKYILALLISCSALFASQSDGHIEQLEKQLISLINAERQKNGLKPLQQQHTLTKVAREHSQNMADKKVDFGHDGFDDRFDKVKHLGVRKFGENVAYSYNVKNPLQTAVTGWMNSKGHRENILNDFSETGMGIAFDKKGTFYVTQLFASRSKQYASSRHAPTGKRKS